MLYKDQSYSQQEQQISHPIGRMNQKSFTDCDLPLQQTQPHPVYNLNKNRIRDLLICSPQKNINLPSAKTICNDIKPYGGQADEQIEFDWNLELNPKLSHPSDNGYPTSREIQGSINKNAELDNEDCSIGDCRNLQFIFDFDSDHGKGQQRQSQEQSQCINQSNQSVYQDKSQQNCLEFPRQMQQYKDYRHQGDEKRENRPLARNLFNKTYKEENSQEDQKTKQSIQKIIDSKQQGQQQKKKMQILSDQVKCIEEHPKKRQFSITLSSQLQKKVSSFYQKLMISHHQRKQSIAHQGVYNIKQHEQQKVESKMPKSKHFHALTLLQETPFTLQDKQNNYSAYQNFHHHTQSQIPSKQIDPKINKLMKEKMGERPLNHIYFDKQQLKQNFQNGKQLNKESNKDKEKVGINKNSAQALIKSYSCSSSSFAPASKTKYQRILDQVFNSGGKKPSMKTVASSVQKGVVLHNQMQKGAFCPHARRDSNYQNHHFHSVKKVGQSLQHMKKNLELIKDHSISSACHNPNKTTNINHYRRSSYNNHVSPSLHRKTFHQNNLSIRDKENHHHSAVNINLKLQRHFSQKNILSNHNKKTSDVIRRSQSLKKVGINSNQQQKQKLNTIGCRNACRNSKNKKSHMEMEIERNAQTDRKVLGRIIVELEKKKPGTYLEIYYDKIRRRT